MVGRISRWGRWVVAALPCCVSAVHAAALVIGQVGPMSGLDATQGQAYAQGMQLCFDAVNRAGGVNGHTLVLERKDDGGRAEDTVALTQALVTESKPLALAGYFGNRNVDALVRSGLLEQNKLVLVGYRASEIRSEAPLLYSVRAGMVDELNKIASHLSTIGITRLGLLYEEGPGAAAVVAASGEAAKKAGGTLLVKASYPVGSARVGPAVTQLLAAAPQAIIMVSTGAAAAGFIEQYRAGGGGAQLFALSGADIEQLSKRLSEEQMQGVAIAQVTPSPYTLSSRLGKELADTIAKAAEKPTVPVSYTMMEGFITCKVITEAVRRQGRAVSREGMKAALDAMGAYDLGGYLIRFGPASHTGSRFVELSIISAAGRIRQ